MWVDVHVHMIPQQVDDGVRYDKKKVKRFSDNTPGNSFRSSADIFSTLPADAQQVALYRMSGGHGE